MENKYNTSMKSELLQMQAIYHNVIMNRQLDSAMTEEEINAIFNDFMKNYYMNLGRPVMPLHFAESGHLPYVEEYNEVMDGMLMDRSILFDEVSLISDSLAYSFNYAQNERTRLNNRVNGLAGLINDLNLIANDKEKNSAYYKDSFSDYSKIEYKMIMGEPIDIATQEGVATLKRTGQMNRSNNATIKLLKGNGQNGVSHVVKQEPSNTESPYIYVDEVTPNNDVRAILDGQPNTLFEYQMVNVPNASLVNTKGYDLEWLAGKEHGDKLRLQLVVELEDIVDINWININPYHPANSTGRVMVYSIRTSKDGFEYESLYSDGNYVLNAELNITPQTYRQDRISDETNDQGNSKFAGQGVWSFPIREAKYVEIVFDQVESFKELIGHTYYERVTVRNANTGSPTETKVRIPSSQVPEKILKGPTGRHAMVKDEYIDKKIEAFNGWRYAIGIRDINIMSYKYAEKSELISKKIASSKRIKQVMLYASEKLPEEYLSIVSRSNEWIQYYVTFDDVTWHRISPMHHQPLGGKVGIDVEKGGFPPKIFEINPSNIELESSLKLHKKYLTLKEDANWMRLKIIMQRPVDNEKLAYTTPVLEEYSVRIIMEEE